MRCVSICEPWNPPTRTKCLQGAQREPLSEQRSNGIWHGSCLRSGFSDGGQIERGARIENKSPFRVAAAFALKRSIFESPHGGLIVWFDQCKPHLLATNEALHRRFSRLRAFSAPNDQGQAKVPLRLMGRACRPGGAAELLGCGLMELLGLSYPVLDGASTYVRTTTYGSETERKGASCVAML